MCDCTRQFWLFLLVIIVKSMPKVDTRAAFGSRMYINAHCSIKACCCARFFYNGHWQTWSQGTVSEAADLRRGIHFPGYGVRSSRSTQRYPFPRVRCRKQHIYGQVSISQATVSEATHLRTGIHFPGYGVGSSRSTQRYPFPRVRCRKQQIYGEVSISQGTVSEATDTRRGIHFPGYGVGSNRSMQRYPLPHLPRYDVDGSRTACGMVHHATQVSYPGDGQDCDGSCLEQLLRHMIVLP